MTVENPFNQTRKFQYTCQIDKIRPLRDAVIVSDMHFGERLTTSGIYLPGDDGKSSGIRPRWCRVYAIGPEQNDVQVGEWILVAHGRWSRGIDVEIGSTKLTLRKIDPKDILLTANELPRDDTMSSAL